MNIKQATQVHRLEGYLNAKDAFARDSKAKYKKVFSNTIEDCPVQAKIVNQALACRKSIFGIMAATGFGKAIIAASIAVGKAHKGPILVVGPSSTSLGDQETGVINKYARVFLARTGKLPMMGAVNEISEANDVNFVTAFGLTNAYENNPTKINRILDKCGCMIVDEAHHFPEDANEDLKVFGRIYDLAINRVRGQTFALTATWNRLDKMQVLGMSEPDIKITLQDAVDLGRCCELYGVQVITDIVGKGATARGDLYDIHLSAKDREKYIKDLGDCFAYTRRRYPDVPFSAFMRSQADCLAAAHHFNSKMNGQNQCAVILASTPFRERQKIIQGIQDGQLSGYITCKAGGEAIDIPKMGFCHWARRTKSIVDQAQGLGRIMRTADGKVHATVIDYQTLISNTGGYFVGNSLSDAADEFESRIPRDKHFNGGPLVVQNNYPARKLAKAIYNGIQMKSLDAERALLVRHEENSAEKRKAIFWEMAKNGMTMPHQSTNQSTESNKIAGRFYEYTNPNSDEYDAAWTASIFKLRPDWAPRTKADRTKNLSRL